MDFFLKNSMQRHGAWMPMMWRSHFGTHVLVGFTTWRTMATTCEFWIRLNFFRHVVNNREIHVDPSKIEVEKN